MLQAKDAAAWEKRHFASITAPCLRLPSCPHPWAPWLALSLASFTAASCAPLHPASTPPSPPSQLRAVQGVEPRRLHHQHHGARRAAHRRSRGVQLALYRTLGLLQAHEVGGCYWVCCRACATCVRGVSMVGLQIRRWCMQANSAIPADRGLDDNGAGPVCAWH